MAKNSTKICLTIAGFDPSGGAGVIADIKTFSEFGCFATSAITSLTFQNTQAVFGAEHATAKTVRSQVDPVLNDFDIDAIKTGMLPTREIIEEVADIITENSFKLVVVDPVVRSTSGYDLIDDRALEALIEKLFPLSLLITPNIPEAERITKGFIETESDIWKAAKIMQSMGARNVLIKGGHFEDENKIRSKATDYLFNGDELEVFENPFIETSATHGTGCTLSAAIAANLALGIDLPTAVKISKDFVFEAIKNSPNIGKGNSPIGIGRTTIVQV